MKIDEFRGDFEYLSNFSMYGVHSGFYYYATSEHLYQSEKRNDNFWKLEIIRQRTPGASKRYAEENKLTWRADWYHVRERVMLETLRLKFVQNPDICEKLLSTVGFELIEGNMWHDNFWGDCHCKKCKDIEGLNTLGRLLTQVRYELKRGGIKI